MLVGKDIGIPQALVISLVGMLVVMFELAMLAVLVYLLSRIVRGVEGKITKKQPAVETPVPAVVGAPLPQDTSAGELKLTNVDEPTAATIMAIVSHQSGIDLNRLSFKSIRLLDEEESGDK